MRKIGFIALLLTISFAAFAQPGAPGKKGKAERKERIHAAKVAFVTQQLELTSQEAEKFWPIYNQWEADRRALRKSNKIDKKKEALTDEEAEAFILNRIATEEDLAKLNKDYYFRLKGVISPKRILKLQKAERQFRKKLLRKIEGNKKRKGKQQKGKNNRPMNPPGGDLDNH